MIKRLSKCIREYKRDSLLAPFFVAIEVIMEVAIPYYMGKLVDNGINGGANGEGDMKYIVEIGALLAVFCVISLLGGVLSGKYAARASAGFSKNLRRDMFYNVQNFSFSNIDRFSVSSLVTRLTTDVTNLQNSYQMIIRIAVRAPLMLIFSLIMSIRVNAKLALIFLCVLPILGAALLLVMSKAHPIFERVFKTYDKLNRVVSENLNGIRVVKSFVREDHEREKFNTVSGKIYSSFISAEKLLAIAGPGMQLSAYTTMLLISWFAAHMIVASGDNAANGMTTGDLIVLMTYSMQILMTFMMLSMVFVMITMSRASAERICEVLNEESDLSNKENPITEVKDGSIEFANVGFSYAKDESKLCLKDVNLKINSGETVGIIGSTGSSKSSFVQLIPRLYDVTTGAVKVGGVDVREYDIESLRNQVAMVLQKNVLFSGTIKENLRWGNENATDEELVEACKLSQADGFISEFPDGYDTYIEQGGTNVSGGQKQRICIARSLLKKPKILILDDSTSAVDTKTDALIRKAFAEYIPETTKIIIAQRISSIEHADKIIVLDGGRIEAVGTHEELLGNDEIYTQVYNSQVKGGDDNGTK
ncbi:MAG: ABC transporter ATP-binding protein/permease [Faecalibacterium sp.]|nr:ABC transporter ATP-binding protein/permease [Ruminococcus sp.]MCM1392609.1 ABC transporter ATP-binding protein/permease [Ruminococcus sp.]MCM1486530.1 ABC transporter ATP-binding protein/permease [Faecalibacterium sp.]